METIYTNARIVTHNDIIRGSIAVEKGIITDIDCASSVRANSIDLGGDFLLPGCIEVHTDNLEKNIQPRPGVIWPSILASALAHDAQVASAGITTVYDAIAVGGLRESSLRLQIFNDSIEALSHGKKQSLFKADHYLHLRCEVSDEHMEQMLLAHIDNPLVRLVSIMDHTPGQRQWSDLDKWRLYHRDKRWTEKESEAVLTERQSMQKRYAGSHRRLAVDLAKVRGMPLASHDDTSVSDVRQSATDGIDISEFPTTSEAAREARRQEMVTIMGAPNAVRGTSHSGNISAEMLAKADLLDGLSSDYVPASLLQAAFILAGKLDRPLPQTVALISCNIADMLGMKDRGELVPGKRADMVQVAIIDELPVIKRVFRQGSQIS